MAKANQEAQTDTQETAVVIAGTTAVSVARVGGSVITAMLEEAKKDFVEANQGLDLDFVRMGTVVKLNKKGQFIEARDEAVNFGDVLDVVVAQGEQRWGFWGKEGSPEDGQLIIAEGTEEEARSAFYNWLNENQDAASRYTEADIQLRYMMFVVRADTLADAVKEGLLPEVYIIPVSPTDTYEWGQYTYKLYQGKFKALGISAKTPANCVITRLGSAEKDNKKNQSWVGLTFTAVGMFVPGEYGIVPDTAPVAEEKK